MFVKKIVVQTTLIKASRWNVSYNLSQRNLVTLQVTALLFIKGRSDMQMKLLAHFLPAEAFALLLLEDNQIYNAQCSIACVGKFSQINFLDE